MAIRSDKELVPDTITINQRGAVKGKELKQSRYRSGGAQRVPGS